MKFDTIKDDDIYKVFFHRLINSNPSEIKFCDVNPGKKETDIFFYFPCDNKSHVNCGFYVVILTLRTPQSLHDYLIEQQQVTGLNVAEILYVLEEYNFMALNEIIIQESLTDEDKVIGIERWKNEWIEELKNVPVRPVSLEEYQRTWAIYEEYHPENSEAYDIFYLKRRQMITAQFGYIKNKMVTFDEFKKMITDSMNKKPVDDEDDGQWDGYC